MPRSRYKEPSDIEFESSVNDVQQFLRHITWRDLKSYLEDRLQTYLNRLKTAENLEQVKFLQGGIANIEDMLELPDQIIEWVETEKDLQEEGE